LSQVEVLNACSLEKQCADIQELTHSV